MISPKTWIPKWFLNSLIFIRLHDRKMKSIQIMLSLYDFLISIE